MVPTGLGCSTLFSVAMINTVTKGNLGQKEFITLPGNRPSSREAKGRNLGAGTKAETRLWENATYWLSSRLTVGKFSHTRQAHLSRICTAHSELSQPTLISNKENDPQTHS